MRHDDFHGTKRSLGRNRSTAANCRGRVPNPAKSVRRSFAVSHARLEAPLLLEQFKSQRAAGALPAK